MAPQLLYALVDCNNFYVSCERVFNPRLLRRPVVVLSNNDGCIIARSNEAKALNIPMGAPLFQYRSLIDAQNVYVCSANFSLYGDMSQRVMQTLETFSPDIQIYSIDEAFIQLRVSDPLRFGREIRSRVLQWTGIPVSVGIAPTKTLAKAAARQSKKSPESDGVMILDTPDLWEPLLKKMSPDDVWGIGRQISSRLSRKGIHSAYDLSMANEDWLRKNLSVVGLRTAMELRGICCLPFDELPEPKKSITCSRSFGAPIDNIEDLFEATSSYAARAAEKLRSQGSLAGALSVFATRHPFTPGASDSAYVDFIFPEPTAYTPQIIAYAKLGIAQIFTEGYRYRKSGIILSDLIQESTYQPDLFLSNEAADKQNDKHKKAMRVLDAVNRRYGTKSVQFAAEGVDNGWKMKKELCSSRFTTDWNEILKIWI